MTLLQKDRHTNKYNFYIIRIPTNTFTFM